MTRKSTAERSKTYRKRQQARGLVLLRVWIPEDRVEEAKAFLRRLVF